MCRRRANYARSRLQKPVGKARKGFFDSLRAAQGQPRKSLFQPLGQLVGTVPDEAHQSRENCGRDGKQSKKRKGNGIYGPDSKFPAHSALAPLTMV